ncbi:MAG: hypothetical protein ACI9H8_000091 [Lysobacterales bacterium]|jgi:hypothetical protein
MTLGMPHALVFVMSKALPMASLSAIFLFACALKPSLKTEMQTAGIEIKGLRIQNESFSLLSEVMLLVTQTGEFISCGNIPMRGQCATTFPLRQYQGNQIEIKWKQGGTEWSTGEFTVEQSDRIDPTKPATVEVIITAQGLAPTRLIQ